MLDERFAHEKKLQNAERAQAAAMDKSAEDGIKAAFAFRMPTPAIVNLPPSTADHSAGFLLPLMCSTYACNDKEAMYTMGPNNQFKSLRHFMILARHLKRTIVLPHFMNHPIFSNYIWKPGSDMHQKIMPTFYFTGEVFDAKIMRSFINTIEVDDFVRNETRQMDLLTTSSIKSNHINPLKAMARFKVTTKATDTGTKTTWKYIQQMTEGKKYVAMRLDHFGFPFMLEKWWCSEMKKACQHAAVSCLSLLFSHALTASAGTAACSVGIRSFYGGLYPQVVLATPRSKIVRDFVDDYKKTRLEGQEYLGIHFRLADRCAVRAHPVISTLVLQMLCYTCAVITHLPRTCRNGRRATRVRQTPSLLATTKCRGT